VMQLYTKDLLGENDPKLQYFEEFFKKFVRFK